jgi:uncharacterized membrane protein
MSSRQPSVLWPLLALVALLVAAIASSAIVDWVPWPSPFKRHLAATTLQFIVLALAGGVLAAWWVGRSSRPIVTVSPHAMWLAVLAGIAAYAVGLSSLSIFRHQALQTGILDLGYYAQLAWEMSQLQVPRSSIWHDAVWGNHATFILAAVAPFLRLHPDPETLLVVQSIVLGLGAVPAYCIGRRVWAKPSAGAVTAGVYLLYPPLQFANLFDFHADTFATPILLAAFASIFAGKTGWALVWAGLLMLVKEDMALVSLTFGLYVAAVHRRPSGLGLAAAAVTVFALLIWVVIPNWTQTPYFSVHNRWRHLGNTPWELIASPVLHPDVFFGTILQPERLGYLAMLVVPLGGLPLLAPEVLAVGLPPLVSNLLSNIEMQYTIRGHYTAALTPILITAAVVGSRRAATWAQERGWRPSAVLAGMAATSVIASVTFSPLPWSQDPFARKQFWDVNPRPAVVAIAARIPSSASVSAANHVGAHLALRNAIYPFPTGVSLADYVIVDVSGLDYIGSSPDPEAFRPLLRRLVETRPLVVVEDGLALFGRGEPSADTVMRLMNLRQASPRDATPVGQFLLVARTVIPTQVAPRSMLRARYSWALRAAGHAMPCVAEALVSGSGDPVWERRRPMFHALLPAEHWPAGMVADDQAVFVVTETVPPGRYAWVVSTWLERDLGLCRVKPHGAASLPVAEVHVRPW